MKKDEILYAETDLTRLIMPNKMKFLIKVSSVEFQYLIIVTVAELPDKPRIMSVTNRLARLKHGELEVFGEHKNISLKCKVTGGDPPPSVTWWKNDILVDTSYER